MRNEYIGYTKKKYVYHQKRLQSRNNLPKPNEKWSQKRKILGRLPERILSGCSVSSLVFLSVKICSFTNYQYPITVSVNEQKIEQGVGLTS
jgi:hypothetical protein